MIPEETISKLESLSDAELVEAYLSTQSNAYFSVIYERYAYKVYGKCIQLLKNEATAKDALQDIFIRIFLKLEKFKGQAKLSTWIYSITYNHCIDIIRKNKKMMTNSISEEEIQISDPSDFESRLLDEELFKIKSDRLKRVLNEISDEERAILLMKYKDELKISAISNIFQISESAVKMRLKRAKEKCIKIHKDLYKQ